MIPFQVLYDRYTAMTKDDSAANVVLGKALVNEYSQHICGMRDWDFLEKERTFETEAKNYGRLFPC